MSHISLQRGGGENSHIVDNNILGNAKIQYIEHIIEQCIYNIVNMVLLAFFDV